MPVGDIYQVKWACFDTDQVGLNIRHYIVTAATPPEPSRGNIADTMTQLIQATIVPMLANSVLFLGAAVRQLVPAPQSVETPTVLPAVNGTAGAISAPRQTSGLIKIQTNVAGRSGRGRIYIPFPSTSSVQGDGQVGPAYITNINTLAGKFNQGVAVTAGGGSLTLFPIIFHRKDKSFTLVTGTLARSTWATQRRRGSFGRTNLRPW